MSHYLSKTLLALLLLLPALGVSARLDPDLLAGLKARSIGPAAVGGRIAAIDVLHSDPNFMVVGVATGGVWLTNNGGLTWTPVFDDQPVASIGAVAIDQQHPDIIWVGTGEGNTRNSTSIGGGLFKTVDGGASWKRVGLENSERINRIALHPDNPDIAYVAALGTLWGPNTERGLYRTLDGGDSWENVLYVDENTGATDIKLDPSNPAKLIAAMWQFRRWPYTFKSGGPGSGMYVSHDGGDSWEQRTAEDGLPKGELGRMAISFAASNPKRVYALVEANESALLHSSDGGRNWTTVNSDYDVAERPFYYTEVFADPANPDRVYNMATRLRVSLDGGKTFTLNPVIDCCEPGNTIHIDNHAFWINPRDPRHLVIGNDGGIAISQDRGDTWRFVRNLPLAQFYHVRVDNEIPYNVYGGLQDNGSWRGPSTVWLPGGIRNLHWQEVGFGDGFDTIPDPDNARAGYAMSQGGMLSRYDLDTGQQSLVRPAAHHAGQALRFNWDAGFAQDPFDSATIYYGSQFLHRSTDRGQSWTVISGDLTSNNPEWQVYHASGGLTPDVTAAENFTTIVAVAPSELQRGLIWVGTDDGRVHVTRDAGDNWQRIDDGARDVPEGSWVPMISPSPHEPGTAFVVFDNHRRSDMQPYVYRVEDYGKRWRRLGADTLNGYAHAVVQDFVDPSLLFVGTEFGLFVSVDAGESWTRFNAGLPTVSVMDMAIQQRESDLVLGTHGRSIYIIDDYSALRGLGSDDFRQRLQILSATTGQHYTTGQTSSTRFTGSGEFRGDNEPYGVLVTFIASGDDLPHPDAKAERERQAERRAARPDREPGNDEQADADSTPKVVVTVEDSRGNLIRTFKHPVQQGVNRINWDLRVDGVRPEPGPKPPEPDADLPAGAEVAPGDYRIRLTLEDHSDSVDVSTAADPRRTVSQSDYESKFATALQLQALEALKVSALERITRAHGDISTLTRLIEEQPGAGDDDLLQAIKAQADDLDKALDALEEQFRVPPGTRGIVYDDDRVSSRLAMANWYVSSSEGAPTATALAYVEDARLALAEGIEAVNELLDGELAALRAAVEGAGIGLLRPQTPLSLQD